jgi:hypothetical protein
MKIDLVRWIVSLKEDNSVVFYYLSASEVWSDKRGATLIL